MRNPNWSRTVDGVRPAYADKIVWKAGGDPTVVARQTLDSTDLLMADAPPSPVLKTAYQTKKAQLSISPLGNHYAALNTQVPPFNNVNLRKAVIAAAGPPGLPAGPRRQARRHGADALPLPRGAGLRARPAATRASAWTTSASPNGDMTVAKKYMKLAGYPSGKYTGNATVTHRRHRTPTRVRRRCRSSRAADRARLQDARSRRCRSRRCTRSSAAT